MKNSIKTSELAPTKTPLKPAEKDNIIPETGQRQTMSEESCPLCATYKKPVPIVLDWISCEFCNEWFHYHCLNLSKTEASRIIKYSCPDCTEKGFQTECKRSSKRARVKIDYVALNDGDVNSSYLYPRHPHIEEFIKFESSKDAQIEVIRGEELTLEYALRTRLPNPVKIPAELIDGLGIDIPNFTIDDLVYNFGDDYPIEVMDVITQESTKEKFNMGKWRDYFLSNESNRDRILNVLSLEISDSSIGESIKRPAYVEQIDLVDKVWPSNQSVLIQEDSKDNDLSKKISFNDLKPKVSKYCLMGVKDSYTDFHLDFAGTSVYYTVLYGVKQFIFFPPTELNLRKFIQWTINPSLNSQFLGNLGLEKGLKVELVKGDVLIIPSGWIHGVYTPIDTLVIGGNFLTSFNITQQLRVIDIEFKTKVDKKFKFPKFNRLMWLTANSIMDEQEQGIKIGKETDIENCVELHQFLSVLLKKKDTDRFIKESIPYKIIGNPEKFLSKFQSFIEKHQPPKLEEYKRKNETDLSSISKKIKQ